jgi:integrase
MAVREVPKNEYTKDGRKWIYELRYKGKRYKSKKFMTKKEALAAERVFYEEQEKTGNQSLMTLGDLFEDHYNYQKDKVKITTLHNYSNKVKHFDLIKDIKLDKLTIQDIEKWKQEINNKNLATRTKNDLMKYLKSTLNYGTKWYDFNFSSVYNKIVNFTNPNEIPEEMQFYTFEEFQKFISVEEDLKFKTLFETLYYCGLRRGELRGLIWSNINFEKKELSVVQNVVNVSGDSGYWQITTPKTRTSKRQVPIPDVLLEDLTSLKQECKSYYGFNDNWFVFGDISPIHPDVLRRRKNNNAKKAEVKQIRLHDFRHSCASLLINNGASVTLVAKYLGHSKIDETLNTYSHVFKNKLDDIVNIINVMNKNK